ncbi:hypothetical protein QTP88_017762 [Uroleucon formosanum]
MAGSCSRVCVKIIIIIAVQRSVQLYKRRPVRSGHEGGDGGGGTTNHYCRAHTLVCMRTADKNKIGIVGKYGNIKHIITLRYPAQLMLFTVIINHNNIQGEDVRRTLACRQATFANRSNCYNTGSSCTENSMIGRPRAYRCRISGSFFMVFVLLIELL